MVEGLVGKSMISFGIMQGRLTPSNGRGIQFFPFDNWKNEFFVGKKIGISEIEWIFDYPNFENNPFWTKEGIRSVKEVVDETGVEIRSVCFDYFMRRPFFKHEGMEASDIRKENMEFIKRVLIAMAGVGAELLEIPMVDDSSVKNDCEKERVIEFLHEVLQIVGQFNIKIGCETDMPAGVFRSFLETVGSANIYANYDSGNSSGLGYDHEAEILSLGEYIANVHIKDRKLHGSTMQLGTGSAEFDKVFYSLKKIQYDQSILLQAARGEDGHEENQIRSQLEFVHSYCKKYGLE